MHPFSFPKPCLGLVDIYSPGKIPALPTSSLLPLHLYSSVMDLMMYGRVPKEERDQAELVCFLLKAKPGVDVPIPAELFFSILSLAMGEIDQLDLSGKDLDNSCIERLSQALKGNATLKKLNLESNNRVTDKAVLEKITEQNPQLILIKPSIDVSLGTPPQPASQVVPQQAVVAKAKVRNSCQTADPYVVGWKHKHRNHLASGATRVMFLNYFVKHEIPTQLNDKIKIIYYLLRHGNNRERFPQNPVSYIQELWQGMKNLEFSSGMHHLQEAQILLLTECLKDNSHLTRLQFFTADTPEALNALVGLKAQITENGRVFSLIVMDQPVWKYNPTEKMNSSLEDTARDTPTPTSKKRKREESQQDEQSAKIAKTANPTVSNNNASFLPGAPAVNLTATPATAIPDAFAPVLEITAPPPPSPLPIGLMWANFLNFGKKIQ